MLQLDRRRINVFSIVTTQKSTAYFNLPPLAPTTRLVLAPAVVYGRTQSIPCNRGVRKYMTLRQGCRVRVMPPYGPLHGNMTSSKNRKCITTSLQCCHRRTERRPQAACTENLVKFGRVVPEMQTNKQNKTDYMLITTLRFHTGAE